MAAAGLPGGVVVKRKPCAIHEAWRPEHLGLMLAEYERRLRDGVSFHLEGLGQLLQYNEVILSSEAWLQHTPQLVEAFFFPDTHACARPHSICQTYAREAHEKFIAHYPALRGTVPLLRLSVNRSSTAAPAFVRADDGT